MDRQYWVASIAASAHKAAKNSLDIRRAKGNVASQEFLLAFHEICQSLCDSTNVSDKNARTTVTVIRRSLPYLG